MHRVVRAREDHAACPSRLREVGGGTCARASPAVSLVAPPPVAWGATLPWVMYLWM